jgi:hypothetical protein
MQIKAMKEGERDKTSQGEAEKRSGMCCQGRVIVRRKHVRAPCRSAAPHPDSRLGRLPPALSTYCCVFTPCIMYAPNICSYKEVTKHESNRAPTQQH